MTRRLAAIFLTSAAFGAIHLLMGADGLRQSQQTTNTERLNFAPGGTIHFDKSNGYLTVEGWDRPEVEITVTKSTDRLYRSEDAAEAVRRLDLVRVNTDRRSDTELFITTTFPPRGGHFLGHFLNHVPPEPRGGVAVEYLLRAPRDSHLVIHHDGGYILLSNWTGDIEATSRSGDITLMLPATASYSIDARSKIGTVVSDSGEPTLRWYLLGERFTRKNAQSSQRIVLRVRSGSITLKESIPVPEARPWPKAK